MTSSSRATITRRRERKPAMKTIRVPIRAEYKIIDGKPVRQSAEYADVDPRVIAEMIIKATQNSEARKLQLAVYQ